jgi:hypothetical protein
MDKYRIGEGPQDIYLEVDVTTIGMATTRAVVYDPDNEDEVMPLKCASKDATGDIPSTPIGAASALSGKNLSIMTTIGLTAVGNKQKREREYKRIKASYVLSHGSDGLKTFYIEDEFKVPSDDFKNVVLFKKISLKADF